MTDKYRQIATQLCDLTENILWAHARDWVRFKYPRLSFATRVGSGMSTYCLYDPGQHECKITFGKKMIASKFNANEINNWITTRELKRRDYFNHEVSLANVLAHTVCHEFAHLIQQIKGWHVRGSVHNRGFYEILDRIHQSGHADKVKQELVSFCDQQQLSLSYETGAEIQQTLPLEYQFKPMDTVCFEHRNVYYIGIVEKINRKTVSVLATDGINKEQQWRVSPELLKPIAL